MSFHDEIAEKVGHSSRAVGKLAGALRDLGDVANAHMADAVAKTLADIASQALAETQPIDL